MALTTRRRRAAGKKHFTFAFNPASLDTTEVAPQMFTSPGREVSPHSSAGARLQRLMLLRPFYIQ